MKRFGGLIVLLIGVVLLLTSLVSDSVTIFNLLSNARYMPNPPVPLIIGVGLRILQSWLIAAGFIFVGVTLLAQSAELNRQQSAS